MTPALLAAAVAVFAAVWWALSGLDDITLSDLTIDEDD